LVIQNKTGLLINNNDLLCMGDAFNTLINIPNLLVTMGNNGREFVRSNYSWDVSISKVKNALQKTMTL